MGQLGVKRKSINRTGLDQMDGFSPVSSLVQFGIGFIFSQNWSKLVQFQFSFF